MRILFPDSQSLSALSPNATVSRKYEPLDKDQLSVLIFDSLEVRNVEMEKQVCWLQRSTFFVVEGYIAIALADLVHWEIGIT